MGVLVCACACVWMPEINTGHLPQSLLVCEVGSLNLELKDSAERAGQQVPASYRSLALGLQMHEAARRSAGDLNSGFSLHSRRFAH